MRNPHGPVEAGGPDGEAIQTSLSRGSRMVGRRGGAILVSASSISGLLDVDADERDAWSAATASEEPRIAMRSRTRITKEVCLPSVIHWTIGSMDASPYAAIPSRCPIRSDGGA